MRKLAPIILIAVAIVAGAYVGYLRGRHKNSLTRGPVLVVTFLEGGLGGGTIVRTPEGKFIVIDPGPEETADHLADFLKTSGVKSLTIVVTNPTRDRAGAVDSLCESFAVHKLIHGDQPPKSRRWEWTAHDTPPHQIVSGGDFVKLSPTANLEVLSPPRELPKGFKRDSDNNSLVLRLSFRGKRFLFASDIRTEAEAYLVKSCPDLASDVFVAARYGRYGSNSLELLSRVRPECCVLMTGRNRPSASVLRRIDTKNSGADLYRTDEDGTIEMTSDGRALVVNTREEGSR